MAVGHIRMLIIFGILVAPTFVSPACERVGELRTGKRPNPAKRYFYWVVTCRNRAGVSEPRKISSSKLKRIVRSRPWITFKRTSSPGPC